MNQSSDPSNPTNLPESSLQDLLESPLQGSDAASAKPWHRPLTSALQTATQFLQQRLPFDQLDQTAKTVTGWFNVDDVQVAEILERVRAELPTTEVILLGKPQAGKSSIVRGLTGVSADIVGQGFRPHTQHIQQYAYPSEELPLLIFTDTVGLGDVNRETDEVIQELVQHLETEAELTQTSTRNRARIFVLTVKVTDFATDSLLKIAQQLHQQFPTIPCLLAVTCLHELYPASSTDHPAYPPDFAAVKRAIATFQSTFQNLNVTENRLIPIDFTLEEDGYTPVFYGLEAFRDALANALPDAESQAIHQLLNSDATNGAGAQLGNLYREVGRRYGLAFAVMAGAIAAVPLPFTTMPVLTALQVSLVGLLGKLYGQPLTRSQAGGIASAIGAGFLAQAIGRELVKFIPGLGSVIAASWAAAYTLALSEAACVYFGDLMGGKTPNSQQIQAVMRESFRTAQERFRTAQT